MPFAGLGGSTVPVAVMERATRLGITAFRSYGSTEHPSITACLIDDPEDKRLTTDGRVLPGVELRLDGRAARSSSRGPDCCLGYTDPELTASMFDDDGWYRTGDVGVLDDEGYLTITDRVSDIIIRGGENISAQEIEELMLGRRRRRRGQRRRRPRRPARRAGGRGGPPAARRGAAVARRGPRAPGGGRAGPAEVARVAAPGRRVPAHAVGEGPEVPAAAAAPRGPVVSDGPGGTNGWKDHSRITRVSLCPVSTWRSAWL